MSDTLSLRPRIKICGITRPQDGVLAAALGADAIGLVFYANSPRNVSVDQAKAVIAALPPFVKVVALFMNPSPDYVREVLEQVPVDLLQFHGEEPASICASFDRPYIKAIPMGGGDVDAVVYAEKHPLCAGFLLDSHALGKAGGSGETFDWTQIPEDFDRPLILAGGLTPANVVEAVSQVKPYAVDISSGVEVSKGVKNKALMAEFIRGVEHGFAS